MSQGDLIKMSLDAQVYVKSEFSLEEYKTKTLQIYKALLC